MAAKHETKMLTLIKKDAPGDVSWAGHAQAMTMHREAATSFRNNEPGRIQEEKSRAAYHASAVNGVHAAKTQPSWMKKQSP